MIRWFLAAALGGGLVAGASNFVGSDFAKERPASEYWGPSGLIPSKIIDGAPLAELGSHRYVTVEGMIVYVAGVTDKPKKLPGKEADKDYHFSIVDNASATSVVSDAYREKNGLTCEIVPTLRLSGCEALGKVLRANKATYLRVRVSGQLRFGSELGGHDGVREYKFAGQPFKGHWEIHPVEKVEFLDKPGGIGPQAKYEKPIQSRYALDWNKFFKKSTSNYAWFEAKVQSIKALPGTGDIELTLARSTPGTSPLVRAIVPQYYVKTFEPTSSKLDFVEGTCATGISFLQPGPTKYVIYGQRAWTFPSGQAKPVPVLWPFEYLRLP